MQVYLVGGAVRDELLGLAVRERDWVVVGATPGELERAGFKAVGREFPVFLHPGTKEEYALARLERKVAPGYRGFVTEFSPNVTLTEDLQRRDLTINAMARAADGQLIDPYGGQADLAARLLRHVSPAFAEDPVRILRVARFAARFADLGFSIAPETSALMRAMVAAGEVRALVSERIWLELDRTLGEVHAARGFEVLLDCGALAALLPELATAPGLPASLAALGRVSGAGSAVRWATLVADLDTAAIESLCARLRVPKEHRELAALTARLGSYLHASSLPVAADPQWFLTLLEMADAFRRPERFAQWLEVLAARSPEAPGGATLVAELRAALPIAAAARLSEPELRTHRGPELAALLHRRRLDALSQIK